MFLKSIEVRGFKSFADKTELIFKKGVSAVVGPNGSGKSNISDAVRWVLGEQSVKSLRGAKMEDVIFAGTQFRKPVGLAQVSLTLENSDRELSIDYAEVTVTRRLYRSGESEYYINNTQCRLKDIQELFMDTGIGKEGYSLIGQGKIEAILSGKPEERRGLLEEAAGIVKFKTRKEEAEKKLGNTEQNLLRIIDILDTYEERLDPLKIETEKAKLFLKLSEDLRKREINIILHTLEMVEEKSKKIKENLTGLEKGILTNTEEQVDCKKELHVWSEKLERLEEKSTEEKQKYFDHKSEYQEFIAECKLLQQRIETVDAFTQKSGEESSLLKDKLQTFHKTKEEQELVLKSQQGEQHHLNEEIRTYEQEVIALNSFILEQTEQIKKIKELEGSIGEKINQAKNTLLIRENEQESLQKRLESLITACETYANSIKINASTKQMLDSEINQTREKIKEYDEQARKNRQEIGRINQSVTLDEKKYKESSFNLSKLQANEQVLINLEKQYEGYNKAVKTLMTRIHEGKIQGAKGKCHVFGEIITVAKEYETAMEIAIGGAISDVITTDEVVAKGLIEYLKENHLGRATFLPLNIIKGRKAAEADNQLKKVDGYMGIASELIEYDAAYKNAIEHVLGRTLICTTMDCALRIAKRMNYSYKIVTLSGEVVNPGGSLTGGSTINRGANIIGRKREIEELQVKILDFTKKTEELAARIQYNKQNIKSLDDMILNLRDEIHALNIEATKLEGKKTAIDNDTDKLRNNLHVSEEEMELMKQQMESSAEKSAALVASMEEWILTQEDYLGKISEAEENLQGQTGVVQEKRELLTKFKIQKAQIDEMVVNKIKDLERLSNELDEQTKRYENIQHEVREASLAREEAAASIEMHEKKLDEIKAFITALEENFKVEEIEKVKYKEAVKTCADRLEQMAAIITKKEEELHRYQLQLARLDTEEEGLFEKLSTDFEMTYAESLKLKSIIENIEGYKREIANTKSQITELGTVNVGAIEEYEEVKSKHAFMNTQKEDLIAAKQELVNVIGEMTEKIKIIFQENFQKLRVNFNETFQELFKGGSADLLLAEGDELSANIEITVQPPGKKLQNINLMSGGEKVLSAIALLFAILKMKPTPFCILDEIEAALDDANVYRYADFLKKFSNRIQFIVITHRKGTMEASDVLYGVTMEEKGISKIVSVDLSA